MHLRPLEEVGDVVDFGSNLLPRIIEKNESKRRSDGTPCL
jgi:hypothetical protein